MPGIKKADGGPKIFLSRLKENFEKRRLIKTTHYFNPFCDLGLFVSVAHSLYNKPYILRLDGFYFDSGETLGSNSRLNAPIVKSINSAQGIIYQSQFTRKFIEEHLIKTDLPSRIIPNGVDTDLFSPLGDDCRKQLNIAASHKVLVTSSSWRAHKRLNDILLVFNELRKTYDNTLHLLIIGKPDQSVPNDPYIHTSGRVDPQDLPMWYRTGDLFLFLSWLDNCPNVVLEAMGCGLPVVCSNQGGTREIVERVSGGIIAMADDEFGYHDTDLYNPPRPDHQVIITSVLDVLENIEQYKSKINYRALSIDRVADGYVKFFNEILAK